MYCTKVFRVRARANPSPNRNPNAPGAARVVGGGGEVVALPREMDAHHVVLAHVQPVKVRRTLLDGHLLRVQG